MFWYHTIGTHADYTCWENEVASIYKWQVRGVQIWRKKSKHCFLKKPSSIPIYKVLSNPALNCWLQKMCGKMERKKEEKKRKKRKKGGKNWDLKVFY